MTVRHSTLVILFADVSKSTRLFEQYGDVRARRIIGRALSLLDEVTVEQGGVVVKTIGDEVMCTFPDPGRAFRVALLMHEVIRQDADLAEVGLAIRVGLHYGDVLLENDDVYGDAVNVAARMVELAKPYQSLTTRAIATYLPAAGNVSLRSLGFEQVRGKQQPIELFEIIRDDLSDLTMMGPLRRPIEAQADDRLLLYYSGRDLVVEKDQGSFLLGRAEENDLCVRRSSVSRVHARIEYLKGAFVLIDVSTNGTYVHIEDEAPIFLHRDRLRLRKEGTISLGEDPSVEDCAVIRYRCEV